MRLEVLAVKCFLSKKFQTLPSTPVRDEHLWKIVGNSVYITFSFYIVRKRERITLIFIKLSVIYCLVFGLFFKKCSNRGKNKAESVLKSLAIHENRIKVSTSHKAHIKKKLHSSRSHSPKISPLLSALL